MPCFNEAARLPVDGFAPPHLDGRRLELVFVDDGSTDATRAVLERLRERRPVDTSVVACDRNVGKAEAVRRGVLHALSRGDTEAVGYWDADLATPLSELPSFVRVLDDHPHVDVVLGSRVKLMGRTVERSTWRHYIGRIFATAASRALELPVYDTQCGAKLFRVTPLLGRVFAEPFLARWVFDVEILARFLALDPRGGEAVATSIYELPLRTWVDVRGSKVKSRDVLRAAFDLARIWQTYRPRCRGDHPRP